MNDIEVKDVQGRTIAYICQCGSVYWPWLYSVAEGKSVRVECDCGGQVNRNHGLSRKSPRRKYRKIGKGQKRMNMKPLINMWGNPF